MQYSVESDRRYNRPLIGASVDRKVSCDSAPTGFFETISSFFPGLMTIVSPP